MLSSAQTATPVLAITTDLLYMLGNVSALVNVRWYLGTSLLVHLPSVPKFRIRSKIKAFPSTTPPTGGSKSPRKARPFLVTGSSASRRPTNPTFTARTCYL